LLGAFDFAVLLLSARLKGFDAAAAQMRAPLADLRGKVAASRVGASTALTTLCTGLEQRAAATSARKLLELLFCQNPDLDQKVQSTQNSDSANRSSFRQS
jgi:hypothetical protein